MLFTPRWEEDPILIMDIEFPLVWLGGCGRPRVARPAWLLSAVLDLFTLRIFFVANKFSFYLGVYCCCVFRFCAFPLLFWPIFFIVVIIFFFEAYKFSFYFGLYFLLLLYIS